MSARFFAPAALALLLSAAAQESDSGRGEPALSSASAVLLRSPSEWPPEEVERWSAWSREEPVPEAIAPLVARVGRSYGAGDLPAALKAIFELLGAAPGYPPALHQAGVIYFRLRRYGDAAQAFERYLRVQPGRVGDTRALGHCYYTLGEYARARAHYERVLAEEPTSVEALRGLALAHLRLGEGARALELLERVVELDPTHANAWSWIAQIHFDAERIDAAHAATLKARELDPYAPRAWFLSSRIEFDRGRDAEGEEAYARFELLARVDQEARALEARLLYDPRQPELLDRLSRLHRMTGDGESVKRALLRWLMLQPDDVGLRIHVLDVLVELGDARAAADAAQALAQVGAEDPAAWQRLALYYAGTRQRLQQVEAERRGAELRARRDE